MGWFGWGFMAYVDYSMPYPLYTYVLNIYDLLWLDFMVMVLPLCRDGVDEVGVRRDSSVKNHLIIYNKDILKDYFCENRDS